MRADPLPLETLAEVLASVVSRHGAVVDSGSTWLRPDELVRDHLGCEFTVSAAIHPGEARDAARDLADLLAAHGLGVVRLAGKGRGA
ncbi:hypothetical protein [Roseicella aerolata]|uniref:Uncharacterized protein n=1 Tax=Roseicella aerolata TaxID=2883479 RepID=A0A9X1IIX8_9PROT|nr:hypothetical protein [Roseicella aerolata]MCB4825495.1 hypothetical protein [Roseicella aerolata]